MVKVAFTALILVIILIQSDEYNLERKSMIQNQIIARGITDKATIQAMESIPRHKFVSHDLEPYAYRDTPLSIGYGQTISQPYIVAYMTASLKLVKTDTVLEIGTGSGYQAAVLSMIVSQVYTVEILKPLAEEAIDRFSKLGYKNIATKIGDGYFGWKEHAPYNAIIVTANVEEIPPELYNQLADNGRMIIPVGPQHYNQNLVLVEKRNGKISQKKLLPVKFVPFTREKNNF